MLQLRSKETLDHGDRGWLKARHHFVVSAAPSCPGTTTRSRPARVSAVTLTQTWKIVTYVRQGVVTHEDSAGNIGRTVEGDIQVMSAGTGISHLERNDSEDALKLFQIWLLPRQRGGTPRWDSRRFPKADRAGRLIVLASGEPKNAEALLVRADARVLGATLLAGTTVTHAPARFRHTYLAPAQGVILVNGQRVAVGDGIAAIDEPELTITAEEDTEFVLVDAA